MNMVFRSENATMDVPLMQLQVKLKKTAEITYLEAKKQETRYRLRYLEVLKSEKRYD